MKLRFSIRDLLWLTLVVAMFLAWRLEVRRTEGRADLEIRAVNFAERITAHDNSAKAIGEAWKQGTRGNEIAYKEAITGSRKQVKQYLDVLDELIEEAR